ncbi:MAG: transporter [Armatimonadota bacterium]|nr:transporter [Armatimonadota bacterium]
MIASRVSVLAALILTPMLLAANPSLAVPPLVAGDVEPAGLGHYEVYFGRQTKQKANGDEKVVDLVEIVYGNRPHQEITVELPYVTRSGLSRASGLGDVVIGTKYQFANETRTRPAGAVSFEMKLANAPNENGLGSGSVDLDIRWRAEKWLGKLDTIFNLGYIRVGDPEVAGARLDLPDVVYWALAGRKPVSKKTKLLAEVYGSSPEEHGGRCKTGFDIGFDYKHGTIWHVAWGHGLGRSSREDLKTRLYVGLKREF